MRVVQAMAGGARGGAEISFERLVPALARAGLEQLALIRPVAGRETHLRADGIATETVRFGGPLDLVSRWRVRRAIAGFNPEIVLSWMQRATSACPPGSYRLLGRLDGFYKLGRYRHCDHIVAVTERLCRHALDHGWPPERVHYVPSFVPDRRAPAVPRAAHDTPGEAPLLVALGRLHPVKGLDVALAALAALPDAYLWLVGDGPERARLRALARQLGIASRLRFVGWQDDPAPYYATADVVVFPSRREGHGNIVKEAWVAGRPIVASAAEGPAELIEDGRTGLVVPIDDAAALAGALRRLIDAPDLRRELAMQGRAAFEVSFTEEIAVARHLELFQQVARM